MDQWRAGSGGGAFEFSSIFKSLALRTFLAFLFLLWKWKRCAKTGLAPWEVFWYIWCCVIFGGTRAGIQKNVSTYGAVAWCRVFLLRMPLGFAWVLQAFGHVLTLQSANFIHRKGRWSPSLANRNSIHHTSSQERKWKHLSQTHDLRIYQTDVVALSFPSGFNLTQFELVMSNLIQAWHHWNWIPHRPPIQNLENSRIVTMLINDPYYSGLKLAQDVLSFPSISELWATKGFQLAEVLKTLGMR